MAPPDGGPAGHHVDGSMVEGLFVRALSASGSFAADLKALGIDLRALEPRYPRAVFMAALDVAAKHVFPGQTKERALYELGRRTVDGFLGTLLGRIISVAVLLGGPERVVEKMPRHARTGDQSYDAIKVTRLAPKHYRADVADPSAVPEYFCGMTDAWLRRTHVVPTLTVEQRTANGFSMDITWEPEP